MRERGGRWQEPGTRNPTSRCGLPSCGPGVLAQLWGPDTYTYMCKHSHGHTLVHRCTHPCSHSHTAHTQTCCPHIQSCVCTHAFTGIHTPLHIVTHTHTQEQICRQIHITVIIFSDIVQFSPSPYIPTCTHIHLRDTHTHNRGAHIPTCAHSPHVTRTGSCSQLCNTFR